MPTIVEIAMAQTLLVLVNNATHLAFQGIDLDVIERLAVMQPTDATGVLLTRNRTKNPGDG